MCQKCQTPMTTGRQLDYLKRYLKEREADLRVDPDNKEMAGEIQRTRELMASLRQGSACGEMK